MTTPSPKQQLNTQFALIAQALASPQRLEILDYLAQAERSVEELSQLASLSVANTSRHLQTLKQSALVNVRTDGKRRLYRLAGDDVVQLIASLRRTAELHLAEVERLAHTYLTHKEEMEAISAEELLERLARDEVTLLDVRPAAEYAAGHIPGAVHLLPEEVAARLHELDDSKTIVAYCRGPYCVYSYQMVQTLRGHGINAARLVDGLPEWKAAGLPVHTTPT
ncbi:MAG: metalloregulator ArsR/SmtB family transcription factor [Gammaproteobacteria bacterium]|nr:metalloregulator ArsR/SmtB family transcription factor [Gammaproteobacteria bacterium]MBU1724788.1 metalloregulator ArsR/SmtB family transcription factor [Gammaproteobacteria bacterium]MBU2006549.1 metalloregulator ArsR/SmtB family transcription factor [Gammaproteobacteria bacterium]